MLKGTAESIAPVLKYLFTACLRSSDIQRNGKEHPLCLFQKVQSQQVTEKCYRPISLLPIASKVLERHVYNLVWEHLEDKGQIPDNQWGFTKGKSTVTALLSAFNSVYQYMEHGYGVILLFLDLSKAFDSVPHVQQLHHLKDTGLNPYIVQWIVFYLLNRKQYVVVQRESSNDTSVVSGVPQGYLDLYCLPSAS